MEFIDQLMQGLRIGLPIEFDERARDLCLGIVRLDGQRGIQYGFFLSIAPQRVVADRNLLERQKVAGVEINRPVKIAQRLLWFALSTLNVSLQLENPGIIWQGLSDSFQLSESGVIIKISPIKILRPCEVCFACIRTQPKRSLDRRFR